MLGKVENTERFLHIGLYQGVPRIGSQYALQRDAAAGRGAAAMSAATPTGGAAADAAAVGGGGAGGVQLADPTIVATAFKRNRFYLFSRREPAEMMAGAGEGEAPPAAAASSSSTGRDVFNEPPSKEDLALAVEATASLTRARLGSEAVLHTTKGDIALKLMPDVAPRAVENFATHARNGYYDGLCFHRVIKSFMIQVRSSGRRR